MSAISLHRVHRTEPRARRTPLRRIRAWLVTPLPRSTAASDRAAIAVLLTRRPFI